MNEDVRKTTPTEDAVLHSAAHELPNQRSVSQAKQNLQPENE